MAVSGTPALAQSDAGEAHKLRTLDIMLMVSSLRCRNGRDDFRAEYQRFASSHLATLNRAGATLQRSLAGGSGGGGARALDRIGVQIANRYGDGHPWMNCAQLGALARSLGKHSDEVLLAEAADLAVGSEVPASKVAVPSASISAPRLSYTMAGLIDVDGT
ncbi:S-adenosyl-L-homocysteine hydrolase [Erythrobacter sp. KY5]|uniref:S-adenosyl-L-homocysteine hydrolase n=1 Tax=Erythrobacter sp. KY5 TaxID=2011159 RepID=UPI000DBEF596|nr:S-adenosyl-L-homocysteine hydrolase [Erythrobacter sp. KY5]AWW74537.1 S-adenosyl-L-homocysteine hydrolase [Erythrobacter sp. KY5]